jgi:hypothetical protein
VPNAVEPCYSGPSGTEGIGICHAGTRTCDATGTAWGACTGEVTPSPEDCTTPADEDCDGQTPACPAATLCAKRFGDGQYQVAQAVAFDGAGNLLITGSFNGTIDLGGGPLTAAGNNDIFVAKFDAACNHLWSKQFHASLQGSGSDISVAANDQVVITGHFIGTADFGGGVVTSAGDADIFLVRLDASGAHVWSHRFGDTFGDQYGLGVAVDGLDRIALTGNLPGSADFGGGPVSGLGFVAMFTPGGQHLWSRGWASGRGQGVAFDPSGNVIVAGGMYGACDFGGGSIAAVAPGDDIYLAKFDETGKHLWSKAFATATNAFSVDVAVDATGDVFLTGPFGATVDFGGGTLTSAGGSDVFVAGFDGNGGHLWSKRFGDAADQSTQRIVALPSGGAAITGGLFGSVDFGGGPLTSAGQDDAFVARLDAAGNHVWSKRFGDAAAQHGNGIAADFKGNVAFVGIMSGTVDFGTGPLSGTFDAFFAKLAP